MDTHQHKTVRNIILDTAIALSQQQAVDSVNIDDICHVAKIRRCSFYQYFASMSDLRSEASDTLQNNPSRKNGGLCDE